MNDAKDLEALAGEYVLGLLDDAAAADVERRLATDAALRAAVGEWRDWLAAIDETADPVEPSAGLWPRIERSLAAAPAAAPAASRPPAGPSRAERLWASLGFWRGFAGAGAAATVALALGIAALAGRLQPQPVAVAVLQGEDAAPGAIVEAFADGSIRLVPLKQIAVPPGRALQVWTLWDRQHGPVPLGLLPAARRAELGRDGLPPPRAEQLYEITLEPASGSPTGRPTGPVLYKGLATVVN